MKISIRTISEGTFTITAELSDIIKDVKSMISDQEGYPPETQRLLFGGQIMDDSNALSHYNIKQGATILLSLRSTGRFQIFVRSLEGKSLTIEVKALDTVRSLKDQIYEREGIPQDTQRLIYKSKPLKDEKILSDYDVSKESTIELVLRLHGGI